MTSRDYGILATLILGDNGSNIDPVTGYLDYANAGRVP
jgi:hypothetical protein